MKTLDSGVETFTYEEPQVSFLIGEIYPEPDEERRRQIRLAAAELLADSKKVIYLSSSEAAGIFESWDQEHKTHGENLSYQLMVQTEAIDDVHRLYEQLISEIIDRHDQLKAQGKLTEELEEVLNGIIDKLTIDQQSELAAKSEGNALARYIGKVVFYPFNEDQIKMDKLRTSYLLSHAGIDGATEEIVKEEMADLARAAEQNLIDPGIPVDQNYLEYHQDSYAQESDVEMPKWLKDEQDAEDIRRQIEDDPQFADEILRGSLVTMARILAEESQAGNFDYTVHELK